MTILTVGALSALHRLSPPTHRPTPTPSAPHPHPPPKKKKKTNRINCFRKLVDVMLFGNLGYWQISVSLSHFTLPASHKTVGGRTLNKDIMTPSLSTRVACRSLYAFVTVGSCEMSCLTTTQKTALSLSKRWLAGRKTRQCLAVNTNTTTKTRVAYRNSHCACKLLVFTRMPGERLYLWWNLCNSYLPACQVRGYTSGGVFMHLVFTCMPGEKIYLSWSLCTSYLPACQVRGYTSGGVYVPCIYSHAR